MTVPDAQTYGAIVRAALRVAWWGTIAGAGALVIGLLVFFVYAFSEVLTNPGASLVDGYWIGRLPWTGIGEGFTVLGATVAVVLGTISVWLGGNRWSRAVVLVPLALAALFWFAAMLPFPGGAPCDDCGAPLPDPFAFAYSLPLLAILMLLLPALVVSVLALLSRPARGRLTIAGDSTS